MTTFEQTLIDEIQKLRTRAQSCTDWTDFRIDIEVRGRVHSGQLKIEFSIGSEYGDTGSAKGSNLDNALEEYVRRMNWNKRNQPLMIGYDEAKEENDDIPF